jgi:hypothetical protein
MSLTSQLAISPAVKGVICQQLTIVGTLENARLCVVFFGAHVTGL